MKASKLLYSMIAVLALLGASCTDDTFMDNHGRVEEGIPVRVQLKFRAEAGEVMTRAEQTEASESRIENAYVFVFDGAEPSFTIISLRKVQDFPLPMETPTTLRVPSLSIPSR